MSFYSDLPDHLKSRVDAGEKYIVATNRQAWLATESAVFTPAGKANGPTVFHVLPIENFWELFQKTIAGRVEFSEADVQKITRLTTPALNRIKREAYIEPIADCFDPQQAFALAMAGVLIRKGCNFKIAVKVARFCLHGEGVTCQKH